MILGKTSAIVPLAVAGILLVGATVAAVRTGEEGSAPGERRSVASEKATTTLPSRAASSSKVSDTPRADGAAPSEVERIFYASPRGRGAGCSRESPCSLVGARNRVRSANDDMDGDIVVYLRGGTYALSSPLELTSQDSGEGEHDVIYRAYEEEKPVISGGTSVSGWSLHDSAKNVYRTSVEPSLQTRQLYVDGVRAIRARGEIDPPGFVKTSTGYTTTRTAMQDWKNVGDVEFVDFGQWLSYRCGVSSVVGSEIVMEQPCWSNSQRESKPEKWRMGPPKWVENAYELLDEPGEWYLDRSAGYLYYKPRPEENMSTATVIVPRLQTLVKGEGTLDDPIHDVHFRGLTFAYATWLAPNADDGYAAGQAGFRYTDFRDQVRPWAAVQFSAAKSIRFERNAFRHLGAVGLSFRYGSQNNAVVGNEFYDLSGGGIYLGDINDHHPSDDRAIVKDNVVENNYITKIGAEYLDQLGIWAGYTDGSVIEHNELYDLPYGGISVGWGWGCTDPGHDCSWTEDVSVPTVARENRIRYNLVHDYMKVLKDGGGIYTLGAQPDSEISNNYLHDQENIYAPLYLDQGTQYYMVENNVLASSPEWLHIWTDSIQNNVVRHNYSDDYDLTNNGTNNSVYDNVVVKYGVWPTKARDVMATAGLQDAYQDIRD